MKIRIIAVLALCYGVSTSTNQIYLDTTFSPDLDGKVFLSPGNLQSSGVCVRLQSSGNIVVVGNNITDAGLNEIVLARYLPDGSLDTSFGTTGITHTTIGDGCTGAACLIQSDSKILVTGTASISGQSYLFIARYTSSGVLDSTFGTSGVTTSLIGTSTSGSAIGLQTSNSIIVVGSAILSGVSKIIVTRFTSSGSVDTSFGSSGVTMIDIAQSRGNGVAIQSNDTIIVGGTAFGLSNPQATVTKLLVDGTIDTTFGTNGTTQILSPNSVSDSLISLGIQPQSGNILATCAALIGTNQIPASSTCRLTTSGTIDTTFGSNGFVTAPIGGNTYPSGLLIAANDYYLISGRTANDAMLARYSATGAIDPTFGSSGRVITRVGNLSNNASIAAQTNGAIVTAGSNDASICLLRYLSDNDQFIQVTNPANASTITSMPTTLMGNASLSNQRVRIIIDSTLIGFVTTDTNGNWSIAVPRIANGSHTITADLISNEAPVSVITSITQSFDVSTPDAIEITLPIPNEIVQIINTLEIGANSSRSAATVNILIDNNQVGSAATGEIGNLATLIDPTLLNLTHTLRLDLIDPNDGVTVLATDSLDFTSETSFLFPPELTQYKIVQGEIPTTGSGSRDGFNYSASGSSITITYNEPFQSAPMISVSGRRASGASTVTVSSNSSSATTLLFSAGTQSVYFTATLLM